MRTITSRVDSTVIQTTIKTLQSLVFLRLHLKVGKEGNQSCRNDSYRQRWWQWDYRLWIITKFVLLNMPDVPYCYLTSLIKKSGQCPSFPLNFSYPCADGRKWWAALNLESRCSHNLRKKGVQNFRLEPLLMVKAGDSYSETRYDPAKFSKSLFRELNYCLKCVLVIQF